MKSTDLFARRARVVHPLAWVWEALESDPGFVLRSMFGAKAVYLRGRLMFCCCAGEEPWNGLLVCTAREHHEALRADFPELAEHPVLGKWLYLSQASPRFESVATALVRRVEHQDPRLGVLPSPKRKGPRSRVR